MKDFKLNFSSLGFLVSEVTKLLQSGKVFRVNIVEWREKRSLSQNALYWKWLGEIAFAMLHLEKPRHSTSGFRDLLRQGKYTFDEYRKVI